MVTQPIWRQFSSLDLRRAFVTAEKLRESNSHLVSSSSSRLRSRCCNKSGGPILDMKMESPASAILPVLLLFFLTYEISSLKVLNRELEAVAGVGVSHWLHADLNPHCSLPECAANATGAVPTIVNLTVQEEPVRRNVRFIIELKNLFCLLLVRPLCWNDTGCGLYSVDRACRYGSLNQLYRIQHK